MTPNDRSCAESLPPANVDTGLACLAMMAMLHGVAAEPAQLQHEFQDNGKPFGKTEILLAAKKLGLKAKVVRSELTRLDKIPLPAIAVGNDGSFFIIARVQAPAKETAQQVMVHDPRSGRPEILTTENLLARWDGELILFTSRASLAGELARFDFSWFVPALVKYRKLIAEVFVVSLFLQLFALVTPLFFQVVMDKVLVHRGFSTLEVIAVGLLAVNIFESILSGLRSYVFSHTTSRIDVELGSRIFRHLITLPIAYFHARRVGDSVARVRELENIRSFLTGNALTLVLDVLFSVVFIAVMLYYSGKLTLIVLASLPLYFLISLLITPVLRARLNDKFNRGAENQSFLVETISAIDTVKSMAIEPHVARRWDNLLAGYISASFRTVTLGTIARELVGLVGKLVTLGILWLGATLVIGGDLTVGQLIAFNMLAGRVAQPIMRLAQLWTDFQQTGISVQRLGDILNTRTELVGTNRSPLPTLRGLIELDKVTFRYRADGSEVLRGISLTIAAGESIGIVGRSGSGKSTLTRLVQRLYVPERGRVLVDGMDLALADPSSLRRQIGVVLQENILFNRSVRDNIALSDPGAPLAKVMEAATLAGAHEFILELPEGYDTIVGEHGSSLSGGQRQRIAIARALITNPRILIFDEATSALDYESEWVIQNNMKAMSSGRTVIIIAHRLSAVRHTNRIIVMERGEIVEQGSHVELVNRADGQYARLLRLQQG
jgi:subfamily B ATP-binding cassette protein HlyB/CyaB